jgi:hypothetical protein
MRARLRSVIPLLCIYLVASPSFRLFAQDANLASAVRVGIMLESPKARIQNLLPQLRERARRIATEKKRNIAAVILVANGDSAVRIAKAANCNYLVRMNVDLLNEVSLGSGTQGPDVNHTGMERAVDGRIVITYRLQSLNDDNILAEDRHTLEDLEYPMDPNPSAFETVVSRAVESATAACMSKLKKKM